MTTFEQQMGKFAANLVFPTGQASVEVAIFGNAWSVWAVKKPG